jgi:hypothetical protein
VEVTEENGGKVPAPRPLETLRRDLEVRQALADGAGLAGVPLVCETGNKETVCRSRCIQG